MSEKSVAQERVAGERTWCWSSSIGGGPIPRSGGTASNIISATLPDTQGSDDPAAALAAPELLGIFWHQLRGLASLHHRVDLAWQIARGTEAPTFDSTVTKLGCFDTNESASFCSNAALRAGTVMMAPFTVESR